MSRHALVLAALVLAGCGTSPIAPPPPPAGPEQRQQTFLTGTVRAPYGLAAGATVTIAGGHQARTDSYGVYFFNDPSGTTVTVTAHVLGYPEQRREARLAAHTILDFQIEGLWQRTGIGVLEVDKPVSIQQVRITGRFDGDRADFDVWCRRHPASKSERLVSERLGHRSGMTVYDRSHAMPDCASIVVQGSAEVSWTLTESPLVPPLLLTMH